MDLKDFIKTTLSSIYNGLKETNKELVGEKLGKTELSFFTISSKNKESLIEFDVALTVKSGSTKKGGGGFKVYVANLSGEKQKTDSEQTISHIKFKIKAERPLQ